MLSLPISLSIALIFSNYIEIIIFEFKYILSLVRVFSIFTCFAVFCEHLCEVLLSQFPAALHFKTVQWGPKQKHTVVAF